jgi:hypothetical protein
MLNSECMGLFAIVKSFLHSTLRIPHSTFFLTFPFEEIGKIVQNTQTEPRRGLPEAVVLRTA